MERDGVKMTRNCMEVIYANHLTVRHYEGVNPEVEAELQKVIEELQTKEIGKGTGAAEGIQVAQE